jgi:hypothetical protein
MAKFCHAQFNDHKQLKSNSYRKFSTDTLYTENGTPIGTLHPTSELGEFWSPLETYYYAKNNFGCNYFFWHYKSKTKDTNPAYDNKGNIQYYIEDDLPVIERFGDLN